MSPRRVARCLAGVALGAMAIGPPSVGATVVRFDTTLGVIDVRLYDSATPLTVANFLSYSSAAKYDGSFFHRAPQDFVAQGGGFTFTPPNVVSAIPSGPAVVNEPGISNTRGTIAMAKTDAGPNTATNQWFFNVIDNSGNLDLQNGGFTVFGRIVGSGLTVIDAINALPTQDLDGQPNPGVFDEVPVRALSGAFADKLVFVNTVTTLNVPAGDYNFDAKVDAGDLAVFKANIGSKTNAAADGDGDGVVDGDDLLVWQRTLGQNFAAPPVAAVPEPAAGMLALIAALGVVRRR